ncbi:MAG: ankyrin repeat domain-containing protein [Candidatus Micrarchaeota archaeon]|nr:ankyrin repeat domain-containing protein [Candidatus Micrarchaeota archaeon]
MMKEGLIEPYICLNRHFQSASDRSRRTLRLRSKIKYMIASKPLPDPAWLAKQEPSVQLGYAIVHAVRRGDSGAVKMLLENGANPNSVDEEGTPLIVIASMCNRINVVSHLLRANACIDVRTSIGDTALMWSAWLGEAKLAKMLIAAGADVNARNFSGSTALMLACASGSLRIAKMLVNKGAGILIEDHWRHTAIDIAQMCGNSDIANYLLRKHFCL